MRPDLTFHLVEPMQRRVAWLEEVRGGLGLTNVTMHAARAEDLRGSLVVELTTARAVAALDKLVVWTLPLVASGGRLVALKGRQARDELAAARPVLRRLGVSRVEVHEIDLLSLGEPTTVVELWKP
jgi:16S rRNA (guanine527-N7)-methyltransferase